jgi:hypothetical protein
MVFLSRATMDTYFSNPAPQDQQRSNEPGFSSPQAGHLTGGPAVAVRKKVSISSRARGASSGDSTHTCGSDASTGTWPARLDALALKMRARMP